MTGELSTGLPAGAPPTGAAPWHRRPRLRGALVEALVAVAVFAAVGAAAGWLWFRVWDPPQGTVADGAWGYDDFRQVGAVFSATGLYVILGLTGGLLLGVLTALVCRRSELATLAAVAVGSALAAFLCYRVGLHLSPADPRTLAPGLPDGTRLPENLTMPGRSPFVAWPLGALVGVAIVYFTLPGAPAATRGLDRNQSG